MYTQQIENTMEKSIKRAQVSQRRGQAGNIHIYFRSNSRHVIFYRDVEKLEFLKRCNSIAKKLNCKILAFVLMDNHVHLQMQTDNLNGFVLSLLRGYVKWYNRLNGISGKLFTTPFGSSVKYTKESLVESVLYILCNPVKAGMVLTPKDYKWSSFKFHYQNYRNPLKKIIEVDTTFLNSIYKSRREFDKAVEYYYHDIHKIYDRKVDVWKPEIYTKLWENLNAKLNGRSIYSIEIEEKIKIARQIQAETGATFNQVTSLTQLNF